MLVVPVSDCPVDCTDHCAVVACTDDCPDECAAGAVDCTVERLFVSFLTQMAKGLIKHTE